MPENGIDWHKLGFPCEWKWNSYGMGHGNNNVLYFPDDNAKLHRINQECRIMFSFVTICTAGSVTVVISDFALFNCHS